jgi:hypothetical protein
MKKPVSIAFKLRILSTIHVPFLFFFPFFPFFLFFYTFLIQEQETGAERDYVTWSQTTKTHAQPSKKTWQRFSEHFHSPHQLTNTSGHQIGHPCLLEASPRLEEKEPPVPPLYIYNMIIYVTSDAALFPPKAYHNSTWTLMIQQEVPTRFQLLWDHHVTCH